jgi:hypothetical protein
MSAQPGSAQIDASGLAGGGLELTHATDEQRQIHHGGRSSSAKNKKIFSKITFCSGEQRVKPGRRRLQQSVRWSHLKSAGSGDRGNCDGKDALAKAERAEDPPMISDVNMLNMDGITLVKEVK